jgi:hypothetical protein
MKNKKCMECRFYKPYNDAICPYTHRMVMPPVTRACSRFEPPTNGDLIISGGMRELAKAMVYGYRVTDDDGQVTDGMLYTWHLPNAKAFTEYNEAVDFLENWLNAPAESEGKDK